MHYPRLEPTTFCLQSGWSINWAITSLCIIKNNKDRTGNTLTLTEKIIFTQNVDIFKKLLRSNALFYDLRKLINDFRKLIYVQRKLIYENR